MQTNIIGFRVCRLTDIQAIMGFAASCGWETSPQATSIVEDYLHPFRDDLHCILEHPYVDAVYRDTYYEYFSSKHSAYPRDSIRISLFQVRPDLKKLSKDAAHRRKVAKSFLGYLTLRPTHPNIVGRSFLNPTALKQTSILTCLTTQKALIFGMNLEVHGFPHSTQDTEAMSCAETSVWTVMDYFSSRYREYRTTLPSVIRAALDVTTDTRMVPSTGLYTAQISFGLKALGFGTVLYDRPAFGDRDFRRFFYTYVESGIPVIALTSGYEHAFVVTGHKDAKPKFGRDPEPWIDAADLHDEFVVMDDNRPPFSLMRFEQPIPYGSQSDGPIEIDQFVVPLYSKIYLDAPAAHDLVEIILASEGLFERPKGPLVRRVLLTSSRSFKASIFRRDFPEKVRQYLLRLKMPKFIWVGEVARIQEFRRKVGSGLLILDATGIRDSLGGMICLITEGQVVHSVGSKQEYQHFAPRDFKFRLYQNNLKGKWTRWRASVG